MSAPAASRTEDEAQLLAFLRGLSDDDRRMRFFSLGNDLFVRPREPAPVGAASEG